MNRFRRGLALGVTALAALGLSGAVYASSAGAHALAAKKAVKVVEVGDQYGFQAKKITIAVGTKVTWTNTTDAPHTITSTGHPPAKFNKQLGTGATVSITFKKAGVYHYFCAIHPYMHGTITVK